MERYFDVIQDRVGNALVSVSITVLNGDGSVPTLYSDNGITPYASNVLTSNVDGEYGFYAANGGYTLVYGLSGYTGETQAGVVLFDPADVFGTPTKLPVAYGGTGSTTLTLNSVIVGAGTSAPTFVAPGTTGNLLTSNGTSWYSTPPIFVTPGTDGNVLTSNGTAWYSAAAGIANAVPGYVVQSFGIV